MRRKSDIRKYIFNRDNCRCVYCGTSDNLTIDHLLPKTMNGTNSVINLVTCCSKCNTRKSNKLVRSNHVYTMFYHNICYWKQNNYNLSLIQKCVYEFINKLSPPKYYKNKILNSI